MKDFGLIEACIAALFVGGAVKLVTGYWQVILVLLVFGALIYVVTRERRVDSPYEYEVREAPPKLPPLPFAKENLPVTSSPISHDIPPDVAELLYMSGDPNLDDAKCFRSPFFEITVTGYGEPSLIDLSLPIGRVVEPAPKLKRYPTYAGMTPDERATYLNWLRNVDAPIDIGYVFVFYYGLERRLATGDAAEFRRAAEMILRLRARHDNASFKAYSSTALLITAATRGQRDIVERVMSEDYPFSPTALALLTVKGAKFNSIALMALASPSGFTNKRYIKGEPELFRRTLDEVLTEKFSEPLFPLEPKYLDAPAVSDIVFANTSLWYEEINVPNVTEHKQFRLEVGGLLREAHERVKTALKLRRKQSRQSVATED